MLAVVLSGAANFGAMQAGALEILMQEDLEPEIFIGSSAGALNAIYMGSEPNLDGVSRLQDVWRAAGPEQVGVPKPFIILRRMAVRQDGLVDSAPLAEFLKSHLPEGLETFGMLRKKSGVQAYAVAVQMESARTRVFGDEPEDRVLDGAMASSAVPPYFPPWRIGGKRYLDGGVYTKLPLLAAIARGARRILAIDVAYAMGAGGTAHGTVGVSGYALSLMVEAQTALEIGWARLIGADVHLVRLMAPPDVQFWDYSQAERLIERGRQLASEALASEPIRFLPRWVVRMRMGLRKLSVRPLPEMNHPDVSGARLNSPQADQQIGDEVSRSLPGENQTSK